ncbi:unnamed protein product [Lymnaea stagnalis]|uniref:Ig-like domain-containing protein n=1 Tax=Lymnaea stagnalis TaxID=6523 RepID=A0AAV2H708_LYMST
MLCLNFKTICLIVLVLFLFSSGALCKTCEIEKSTDTTVQCDVSDLNTTYIEWRAYNNITHDSLTLYTCEMTNCSTVTPLLNNTLEVVINADGGRVVFSILVIPRKALYFNEFSEYRCFADVNASLVCDTPNVYADVIDPRCEMPTLTGEDVQINCRALTHFLPSVFNFTILTNNQSRDFWHAARDYYDKYFPLQLDGELYYTVNFTLDTDLGLLGAGHHEFILEVDKDDYLGSAYFNEMPVPANPDCDYPVLSNNSSQLVVKCRTALVFPELVCDFNIRTNDLLVNVTGEVSYATSVDPNSSPVGYLSECTLYVGIRQLGPGSHEFQVVMSTNSSYDNSTRVTGNFTSPYLLTLPTVRLSDDCLSLAKSLYAETWSVMSCTCILSNKGFPQGSITWSVNHKILYVDTVLAHFSDFINNITYECSPISPLKNNIPGAQLKIEVPRDPYIASFTANSTTTNITAAVNTSINFRCDADGFPTPVILFGKNGSESIATKSGKTIATPIKGCMDAGLYCCKVDNSTKEFITRQCISVYVTCPLVPQNNFPINVTSLPGKDVNVTIPVMGYPAPTHYMLTRTDRQGEVIPHTLFRFDFSEETPPNDDIELTILRIQDANFTGYTLLFGNGLGVDHNVSFVIHRVQTPDSDYATIRNIALGITGGVVGLLIIVVIVVVLMKKGSFTRLRSNTSNSDVEKFTNVY